MTYSKILFSSFFNSGVSCTFTITETKLSEWSPMTSLYHISRTGESGKEEPPLIRLGEGQPSTSPLVGEVRGKLKAQREKKNQNIEEGEKIKAYKLMGNEERWVETAPFIMKSPPAAWTCSMEGAGLPDTLKANLKIRHCSPKLGAGSTGTRYYILFYL